MAAQTGTIPMVRGPRGRPLAGVYYAYRRDPLGFFTRVARDYGDYVRLRFGPQIVCQLNHPDLIDEVLVAKNHSFVKGPALRGNRMTFGNGLLTSEGDLWRRQRRLVQPAFRRDRVAAYAPVMVNRTLCRMAEWRDGQVLDVHEELMRITMEIAAETLFGATVGSQEQAVAAGMHVLQEAAMRRFNSLVMLPEWIPTPTHVRAYGALRRLNRIVYGFIRERRASGEYRGDLLSELLNAQDVADEDGASARMSDRQVRDEVLTLFLAGHETTALALTWTLMLLSQNRADELQAAEEVAALGGRPPALEDRERLEYTERVVLEGMRLYPPAWALSRTATEDVEIGGSVIRKGTLVLALPWVVHRDPRFFADPERFAPDRWDDDLMRRLPRNAYFPFGGGPRICVGSGFAVQEAVLVLAALLQRYRFELVPDHPIVLQTAITLRPKHGVRMVARRR